MAAGLALCCGSTLAADIQVGVGGCTLNDAIRAANADAPRGSCPAGNGADTIRIPGGSVQAPASALAVISSAMTLLGGTSGATISGSNQRRVLQIDNAGVVVLENLTLIDGEVDGVTARGGAALLIEDSEVTLRDVNVRLNTVQGGVLQGGGVRALDSTLRIEDSLFEENKAGQNFGGGSRGGNVAVIGGQTTIIRSTLRGYEFEDYDFIYLGSSGAQRGGGLWAEDAQVEIIDSMFDQHIASDGADVGAENSNIDIVNSTFSRGEGQASRIWRDAESELRLYNSTVWASTQSVGFAGDGDLRLYNSLLVGYGIASMCEFANGVGSVTGSANTLAPDDSCFGPGTATPNMPTWVDAPANNGGPTLTARLRPSASNLAINGGDPATCMEFDQRGVDRGASCDIGAYEVNDRADLTVDLTLLTLPPYYIGKALTWRARIGNLGPADAIGASASFTLSGATLQNFDGAATCTGLTCRIERINVDGVATLLLNATANGQATFSAGLTVNSVTDFALDPDTSNNSDTFGNGGNVVAAADIALRQRLMSAGPWVVGQTVQFEIEVENFGPNGATAVDIGNALIGLGTYSVTGCNQFSAGVCRLNSIGVGVTRTLIASATITATAARSQPSAAGAQHDPIPANNVDTLRFTTATKSDVSVRMRMQPTAPYFPFLPVSWVIEVTNAGPDPATNVRIDQLMLNASLFDGDTLCPFIPCVIPVINAGTTVTTTWSGETGWPGPFLHRVNVSADQTDPNPANNVAENTGTVLPASDPVVDTWKITPAPHFVGNTIVFGAQVFNDGPNISGPIEVRFETQRIEILGVQSPSCATTQCVLQSLEVGEENGETFTVTARILEPGAFFLRVRAISSSYDVVPGNSASTSSGTAVVHANADSIFSNGFE